jgi:hypothetical protein
MADRVAGHYSENLGLADAIAQKLRSAGKDLNKNGRRHLSQLSEVERPGAYSNSGQRRWIVRRGIVQMWVTVLVRRSVTLRAQSGHQRSADKCPLSGVKRTRRGCLRMSANDPKRT